MGKLHEVIAVESSLNKAATKLADESKKTLGKENLFSGSLRKLTLFDTSLEQLNTEERVHLTSTVDENLEYLVNPISDYWDAVLQKDLTNQAAVADIILAGTVIASNIPATFLLGLETKLGELRKVYEAIHTLPPGVNWVLDTQEKAGVYKSTDNVTYKTEKDMEFKIMAEATKEHPAQVAQLAKTNNVGRYDTTRWSGLLTPLEKAMRLQRIDQLLIAVKKARQRANNTEVVVDTIGRRLFEFINISD